GAVAVVLGLDVDAGAVTEDEGRVLLEVPVGLAVDVRVAVDLGDLAVRTGDLPGELAGRLDLVAARGGDRGRGRVRLQAAAVRRVRLAHRAAGVRLEQLAEALEDL